MFKVQNVFFFQIIKKNTNINTYLEVGNSLANLLDLSSTFEPENEWSLGRRVDSSLSHDQILEVQATVTRENLAKEYLPKKKNSSNNPLSKKNTPLPIKLHTVRSIFTFHSSFC